MSLSTTQKILGLDHGTKTIGLAIGDTTLKIASPIKAIKRRKFSQDAEQLFSIIDEYNIGLLVLGLPLNMDGSNGPRVQSVKTFAGNLKKLRPLDIQFQDERCSTQAMQQEMLSADLTRQQRAKRIDSLAAQWILQGWLDRQ